MTIQKVPKRLLIGLQQGFLMSDVLIDLAWLTEEFTNHVDSQNEISSNPISLAALKFTSDNIDVAKEITTEGLTDQERARYIRSLSEITSSEIFEFSTCNRVLYVGFGITKEKLKSAIINFNKIDGTIFETFEDNQAWRQLVKICSGLDSFIIGELQVMSQFRKSVNFHREHGLISHYNSGFFEHIIAANRSIRKQLGFNNTTESMLSLATSALDTLLEKNGPMKTAVLGFGDMGMKAVEALLDSNQRDILVVSRDPDVAAQRNPGLAKKCTLISHNVWAEGQYQPDLIISTIRNASPSYHQGQPLPINTPTTVMDFSWPPSFETSALNSVQTLLGMNHWIKISHNLGKEWDYDSTIVKSETMIDTIQKRYSETLGNKAQGKFRAHVYHTMETIAKNLETSPYASSEDIPQLGAFSREIATWICHQSSPFHLSTLSNFVINTKRSLSTTMLTHVDHEVKKSILAMSNSDYVIGGAS